MVRLKGTGSEIEICRDLGFKLGKVRLRNKIEF